jgi:quinolinate synthase
MLKPGDIRKRSDAEVIVHPECTPSVIALADRVMSTSQMLRYVKESRRERFVIGTEAGMIYPLKKQNPGKEFIPLSEDAVCFDMKRTTIDKVVQTMEQKEGKRKNIVTVPEDVRVKAKRALDRMLEIG